MDEVKTSEANPVNLDAVKAAFGKVSKALEPLTPAEKDRVLRGVSIILGLDA
jgi:hypothetical protein